MITRKTRTVIAVALSLIMALAYMPCVAFATGGDDGQTDTGLKGREFINKTINDHNGYDLDEIIAICKVSTYQVGDGNGGTISTVADIANSANFEKIINQACTYENLKKSIAYMRECNAHRELAIHNADALKVSYQLMGTAIVSAALNEYVTAHMLMHVDGEDKWTFWKSGNSMACSENLAFSSASKEQGWDPFHGWYYEERIKAIANGENPSQSDVDKVLNESSDNGYTYDPYGPPWGNSKEEFLVWVAGLSTGHYTNMINPTYKATGFCYVDAPQQYALTNMPYVASQEFNSDTSESVTIDQYEQELDTWFKTGGEGSDTPGGDTPGGDTPTGQTISIQGDEVILSATSFTYNGSVQKPSIETIGGRTLKEGTDYIALWSNDWSQNAGSYLVQIVGKGNYTGMTSASYEIEKASVKVTVPTGKTYTYNGSIRTGVAKGGYYSLSGTTTAAKAGDYTAKATLNTNTNYTYKWSDGTTAVKTIKWKINKAANPMTVKGRTAKVKYSKVKKKNQTLKRAAVLTVAKNQGKVTYAKSSGNAKITINKTTGKVTVKKGLKKGSYNVKVKVTAAGNSNYNKITKTVKFTVKVVK